MVTEMVARKIPASRYHFATCAGTGFRVADRAMVTAAPTGEMVQTPAVVEMKPEPASPIALTGRQKVALMLVKGGYTHEQIAGIMGIKNRETASRLIARARRAERAFHKAVADFIACS